MPSSERVFPEPDSSHASPQAARVLTDYHRAKWDHDLDAWMGHFAPDAHYADATLGWYRRSAQELREQLAARMPEWGEGRAWATRVIGGDHGAVVAVTDDPQLFGGEIRALSAVLMREGKVIHFVDYWDTRHFGTGLAARLRTDDGAFPPEIEAPDPRAVPDPQLERVCRTMHRGLANNDVDTVLGCLAADATWEDLTLHTRVVGPAAIGRYLTRCAGRQPYARDTEITTILGGPLGGGWQWRAPGHPVRNGIVAVELDARGVVSRLTTVWDGGRITDGELTRLVGHSIEPAR